MDSRRRHDLTATRRVTRPRRAGMRGQALVETVIVIIAALTLFVGVYAVSVGVGDANQAGQAGRAGARYGAQLGGNHYLTAALDPCQGGTRINPCVVDDQIMADVLTGLSGMRFATISAIIVYEPCDSGGCATPCADVGGTINVASPFNATYDYGESYTVTGPTTFSAPTAVGKGLYSLDKRLQAHPNEQGIGVEVDFTYASPTPLVRPSFSLKEYAVQCLAPA
jgi:hypothetical protein